MPSKFRFLVEMIQLERTPQCILTFVVLMCLKVLLLLGLPCSAVGRACELVCIHVALYMISPPSILPHTSHHRYMGVTLLWHLASIFKVSCLLCHNACIRCYWELSFHEDIWSLREEQTSFEIQSSLKSINFTVDADGKMLSPVLFLKYVTEITAFSKSLI